MSKFYQEILWRENGNFSHTDTAKNILYLQVYPEGLRYWVSPNNGESEILYWKDYQFLKPLLIEEKITALREIYASDNVISQENWAKIFIQSDANAFSLVPTALFEEDNLQVYLKNISFSQKDTLLHTPQKRIDAVNVFVVPEIWSDFFSAYYPKDHIKFCHPTQVFLESIKENVQEKDLSLHLLVEKGYIIVIALRNGEVEFCNIFNYNVANDVLYFLTTVAQSCDFNREKHKVFLYGKIHPSAEIFVLLEKYFAKLYIQKDISDKIKIEIAWATMDFTTYYDLLGMCFV